MKNALGAVQSVLVLGGGSDIGQAIAKRLAAPRYAKVVLAARRPAELTEAAAALLDAGARQVETLAFDACDTASHEAFIARTVDLIGDIDVVVVAFGLLGDQLADEAGGDGAVQVARTNYVGAMSISLAVARRLRHQGHGTLVVLSSVAGERARRDNFIYGSTKAGVDTFAQGLADSLAGSGARVLIVRPGFVETKMTSGLRPAPLATTPAEVADATLRGLISGREIIWVPARLRAVFVVLRHLPRPVWRRLTASSPR